MSWLFHTLRAQSALSPLCSSPLSLNIHWGDRWVSLLPTRERVVLDWPALQSLALAWSMAQGKEEPKKPRSEHHRWRQSQELLPEQPPLCASARRLRTPTSSITAVLISPTFLPPRARPGFQRPHVATVRRLIRCQVNNAADSKKVRSRESD